MALEDTKNRFTSVPTLTPGATPINAEVWKLKGTPLTKEEKEAWAITSKAITRNPTFRQIVKILISLIEDGENKG